MTRKMMMIALALLTLGMPILAIAQSDPVEAQAPVLIDGEVTKIDESAQKITIRHGPIKKFEMEDTMTMVFRAQDPAMLTAVKPGDKIKFDAERINGQFTVVKIEKAK